MKLKERKMTHKRQIKLTDLLLDIVDITAECWVSGITLDSRTTKEGDLFLACKGSELDGRSFIIEAVNKGAAAIICEDSLPKNIRLPKELPLIIVPDLRWKLGLIAAKFYDYPARKLTMIGVTGTNGKTSITQYIGALLTKLGISCGVIGTLGVGLPGRFDPSINTTLDPIMLHRLLFELSESGAKAVAMEVSSHGLVQGRVSGIDFAIAVFTNLTHEHLDYHGTMKDYADAKKILFLRNKVKHAVINIDDEFACSLAQELKISHDVYSYTITDLSCPGMSIVRAQNLNLALGVMSANISTPWGKGLLKSRLLGRFNLSNLMAVITVLGIMQFNIDDILAKVEELDPISGRMEVFGGTHKKPLVVIDYAHTPDALEKALSALREYCKGALWCVFGCGGDRDREKRSIMGRIAERLSDHVVITNDNPRTEDPKQIVDDILQGLLCPWSVEVEYDRESAIEYAINHSNENDLILFAGKGSEDYQIIGKERLPFSDKKVVMRVLETKAL